MPIIRRKKHLQIVLDDIFEKSDDEEIYTDPPIFIYTQQHEMYAASPTAEVLQDMAKELKENIEKFELTGSGFIIRNLVSLTSNVWQLKPLRGGTHHRLPKWVENSHGVVNIKSNDLKCFVYACLLALFLERVRGRKDLMSSYRELLNDPEIMEMFWGLSHPLSLKDIEKFTKNNPSISVKVYTVTDPEPSENNNSTSKFIYLAPSSITTTTNNDEKEIPTCLYRINNSG